MIHLQLGGLRLALEGGKALPPALDAFHAPPSAPDLHLSFTAPPLDITDRFQRGDFAFAMRADRRRAWASLGAEGGVFTALELALQRALLPMGGLLIHAAAGVIEGEGWLLLGPSGAGKSTSARVAGFERVLTDEMVILTPGGPSGYQLWGTPFWSPGRARPCDPGCAPLRQIVWLGKSPDLVITPLRPDEGAVYLLRCVTLYEEALPARRRAFEIACEVAEAAPSARLAVPKERAWAKAAYLSLQHRSSTRGTSSASPKPTPSPSPCTGT
ncbi:hypothetical protein KKF91_06115 [Myxococcota bacterium]|nr:hypothetical protein [Myxococcota bacterium]MBU1430127.1 hypothetical protein [Myxococcota bacterium]MBU1896468.1 hypothetical protein [Myxococcota bacterium]